MTHMQKKKNENKYSKSLNMQYKEKKINMQVMHFEEMCRFYYFILKEKKCMHHCVHCMFFPKQGCWFNYADKTILDILQ